MAACALLALALTPLAAQAQGWGTLTGRIVEDATGLPIPGAAVVVAGTNFGTSTDADGTYDVRLPAGEQVIEVSSLGYAKFTRRVDIPRRGRLRLDARLEEAVLGMDEVEVVGEAVAEDAGVYNIAPAAVRQMPTPVQDPLRALKVMPGVASNNELSSQYSVRGGGYNENLLFLNGFEIFLPFRPKQGEQEGLSLLNAELMSRVTFYTGGFPARYGGKLSSALSVDYLRPRTNGISGSGYASLLDYGAAAYGGALDGRLGWVFGLRKSRPGSFFGTQELKGDYEPDYTDVQGMLSYRIRPGLEVEGFGVWARHDFMLEPQSRTTNFGTVSLNPDIPSDLRSLNVEYAGEENSGFATRFGGLRLSARHTERFRSSHDAAYFSTVESEERTVRGAGEVFQINENGEVIGRRGQALQEDFADNRVEVSTLTGKGRYLYTLPRHALEGGWSARRLQFDDRIDEYFYYSTAAEIGGSDFERSITDCQDVEIVDTEEETTVSDCYQGQADLGAWQLGAYVQDAWDVLGTKGRLILSPGLRADYFSFNEQLTLSPRLSARYRYTTQTTLLASLGVYHQAPTYRELRGEPPLGSDLALEEQLNRDMEAQRSIQAVAGFEHFLEDRRLYLRLEGYYKHLTNLVSYDVQDVRVEYSGENNAQGYTAGFDLQLRGEFVPGLESWINYSFLMAREEFLLPCVENQRESGCLGQISDDMHNPYALQADTYYARPTDQRHTFSLFLQDYIPTDPTWKLHARFLFGSGFPYTPPVERDARSEAGLIYQVDGPRYSERLLPYQRVDLGATKEITVTEQGVNGDPLRILLTGELLNIFDMQNTVGYSWQATGADSGWERIPKRLTPRTVNVRLRVEF